MATSTIATTTPSPPPPPEPPTTATAEPKVSLPPPLPPPASTEPDAPVAATKRKLEEVGFHNFAYYKIRAAVADLRPRFLQVGEATDFRNSDAVHEILKEIKVVMELSKKMRTDLSAAAEPVKPSEKPSGGAAKEEPADVFPSEVKNQTPLMGQDANFPNKTDNNAPLKSDNSESTAEKLLKSSEVTEHPKLLDEDAQGSFVVGGSPIGWNFLVWPGSKVVYYGLTKEEWLARQAAN